MCEAKGKIEAAEVVDHVRPHRGDLQLFWDEANWQSLCAPCHDRDKQSAERRGVLKPWGDDAWDR
nr:HNH endonuclease [Methylocella silvestris]